MSLPHDPASLVVHLPAVPSEGARIAVRADREVLGFEETAFVIVGHLSLTGRIERLEREGFRLRAHFAGGLRTDCVRCLAPVSFPLDEALDLVYLPPTDPISTPHRAGADSGERFLEASDMNVSFYDADDLDLAETLWEQVHLALPPKPLCSTTCLGLCPSCGADRNATRRQGGNACGCREESVSRNRAGLGALRDLFASGQSPR